MEGANSIDASSSGGWLSVIGAFPDDKVRVVRRDERSNKPGNWTLEYEGEGGRPVAIAGFALVAAKRPGGAAYPNRVNLLTPNGKGKWTSEQLGPNDGIHSFTDAEAMIGPTFVIRQDGGWGFTAIEATMQGWKVSKVAEPASGFALFEDASGKARLFTGDLYERSTAGGKWVGIPVVEPSQTLVGVDGATIGTRIVLAYFSRTDGQLHVRTQSGKTKITWHDEAIEHGTADWDQAVTVIPMGGERVAIAYYHRTERGLALVLQESK